VEFLTSDNERLQSQSESLKEEIVNLKTLLLAHKECPVAQANGFQPNAIQKTSSPMMIPPPSHQQIRQGSMMPPYSMASGNRPGVANSLPPSSSTNNASPYQHSSRINMVAPTNNQQSMVAGGGSSSVMRL
jgi:hypothetical protein